MRIRRSSKKKLVLITVVALVVLVSAGVLIAVRAQNENKTSSINNPEDMPSVVGNEERAAVFYSVVNSAEEYEKQVSEVKRKKTELVKISDIGDVDWSTKKAVGSKLFLSPGQSIQSSNISDDGIITVVILGAPGGCVYTAAQSRHLAYTIMDKDQEVKSENTVKISIIDNDAQCEQ